MAKREYLPDIEFPLGVLEWPYLNRPDTKFNAAGEYKTNVRIPQKDVEEIIQLLEKYRDEFLSKEADRLNKVTGPNAGKSKAAAKALVAKPVFTPAFDDEGNETDEVIFKTIYRGFKDKATDKMVLKRPVLVDAKRNAVTEDVWGGSKAYVTVTPNPYVLNGNVGVSLRLKGSQVIDLVTGSGDSANSMFKERDGFESSGVPAENVKTSEEPVATNPSDATESGDEDWA